MQLCALRYLGFVPEDLTIAPLEAIRFVANQLKVSSSALETYGRSNRALWGSHKPQRIRTQPNHFNEPFKPDTACSLQGQQTLALDFAPLLS